MALIYAALRHYTQLAGGFQKGISVEKKVAGVKHIAKDAASEFEIDFAGTSGRCSGRYHSCMLKRSLADAEHKVDGRGNNQTSRLMLVSPPHSVSGFGMLREQLADLPSDWNSAEMETDFVRQFSEETGD